MEPFQVVLVCWFSLDIVVRVLLWEMGKTVTVRPNAVGFMGTCALLAGCVLWL